MQPWGFL